MMHNTIHTITGRGAGYQWEGFPTDGDYQEPPRPDVVDFLRSYLQLDDQDYHVVGVLQAFLTWREVTPAQLEDLRVLQYYKRPADIWLGASLVGNAKDPASFTRSPSTWPVAVNTVVVWRSTTVVKISQGDRITNANFSTTPDGGLEIEWPEDYRVRGTIMPLNPWDENGRFEIWHHPCSYPYDAVLAGLVLRQDIQLAMIGKGVTEKFVEARTAVEKLGILLQLLV